MITDPEELTLQTPESFFKRFRINMKIHHEVISIHPECKTVSVKNLENSEIFEENYDKLILSPGAKPTQPRLPGVGIDKLFTLRTVEDTFRIKEYINKNHPKSAVLAGPANKQGRIIADNICGGDSRYLGSQGSSVIKVFDMTAQKAPWWGAVMGLPGAALCFPLCRVWLSVPSSGCPAASSNPPVPRSVVLSALRFR